jgi:glycine/D-amino acid oxidase-like deaminating enzyme
VICDLLFSEKLNRKTRCGMADRADIVIVGGGIVGSSVALNLIRDGFVGKVLVIERDPSYRFASSSLAMGGVRQQFMSRVNIQMVQYSVRMFESTPEILFQQRAYLFLGNPTNWSKLQRRYEAEKELGAEVDMLDVAAIRRMVPEVRDDDLVGAVFGPKDGYVDARAALRYFRDSAETAGAQYLTGEVDGVEIDGGSVRGVHAKKHGTIDTPRLLIACGAYSAPIAALAGVDLRVEPVRQQLFRCALPRPWTYQFPIVIDPGGVHWRSYGENEIVIAKTRIDEEPGIRFDAETNRFYDEFLPDLIRRVPEFAGLGLVSGWGGLYEMTPDHNGIICGHPSIEGLYFACGFSGHGLMMSPATGKVMSEIIRTGKSETVDVSVLAVDRFERGALFFDEAMI